MRGATYSGVFTLMPLLRSFGRAHHGEILRDASALADSGKLRPSCSTKGISPFHPGRADIAAAHVLLEAGALGKVAVEL